MSPSQSRAAKSRSTRSRANTEQRLIDVALELIQKNGVLAGLNLREVAEAAGVNRGNIYHYFGSRQELLRAAINQQFQGVLKSLSAARRHKDFVSRRLEAFRIRESSTVSNDSKLRALLVLDGDDTVDPIPRFESGLSELRQDVIDGAIPPGSPFSDAPWLPNFSYALCDTPGYQGH